MRDEVFVAQLVVFCFIHELRHLSLEIEKIPSNLIFRVFFVNLVFQWHSLTRFVFSRNGTAQAHRSSSRVRPRPGVYEECLRKADAEEELSITVSAVCLLIDF